MIEQAGSSAPRLSRLPRARDPRFIRVTDVRMFTYRGTSTTTIIFTRRGEDRAKIKDEERRPCCTGEPVQSGGSGGCGDDDDDDDDGGNDGDDDTRGIFCTLTRGAASEQSPQQAPSPSHAVCERTDQPLKRHVTTVRLRRGEGAALPPRASRRAGTPRGRTKMYEKPAIVAVTRTGAYGEREEAETRRKEEVTRGRENARVGARRNTEDTGKG